MHFLRYIIGYMLSKKKPIVTQQATIGDYLSNSTSYLCLHGFP